MYFSQNWNVRKPLARGPGGVVASQHQTAAGVGARVLAAGGNAVDAAVATGFALSAVEPWNSGIGGVGFMLVYMAKEKRVRVVDFGPLSPRGLDPKDYPLVGGETRDLFVWPSVLEDRNVQGPMSFVIPGHVEGMGLAHRTFGTKPWAELLAPAIGLAEQGMPVDWFLTLKIAVTARELGRYPSSRAVWMPDGLPPVTPAGTDLRYLKLNGLDATLKRIAQGGPREYYEGALARDIAADVREAGGILSLQDLQEYHARIVDPLEIDYRGVRLSMAGGLTAGPTMKRVLDALAPVRFAPGGPGADAFLAYARELRAAYADRLENMGDGESPNRATSTTHFNVVDREGNMVAVTQTLLSVFGSRFVLPKTGILMNNGVLWFDTRPGTPNYLGPNKRGLTNMSPVLAQRGDRAWFALGASGGRKIFPAVMQIASFLVDHGLSLEDAFHQPRIDASGGDTVGVDPRLPAAVKAELARAFPTQEVELQVLPNNYACPSSVMQATDGAERLGISDVMSPWSGAVSEDMVKGNGQ